MRIEQVLDRHRLYPLVVVTLATVAFMAQGLTVLEGVLAAAVDRLYVDHFEVLSSAAPAAPVPVRFEYRFPDAPWEIC
jgi:hypothetical protein